MTVDNILDSIEVQLSAEYMEYKIEQDPPENGWSIPASLRLFFCYRFGLLESWPAQFETEVLNKTNLSSTI